MIGPLLYGSLALAVLALVESGVTKDAVVVETAAPPARELLALRADVVHLGDGRSVEGGVVLIENGRVRAAGADVSVPEGTPTLRVTGHLAPGFVAPFSNLVAADEAFEATRGFLPDAMLVHGFRPSSGRFEKALGAGVTTVVLAPPEGNAVGGITGVVKTAGGRVLRPRAHLALSLTTAATDDRRYPTSFSGLANELRTLFGSGEGAYGAAARGELPVLVTAEARHEVVRALALGNELGLSGALVGAPLAGEQLDVFGEQSWPVVFAAPGIGASTRVLDAMAAYAKSGRPFAFAYDDAHTLRFAAAQLLRRGVDPAVVLRALTADGAAIAGVGDRVGRLERGFEADLVLWSGSPLDLASRPLAVYVDGRLVHGSPHADPNQARGQRSEDPR